MPLSNDIRNPCGGATRIRAAGAKRWVRVDPRRVGPHDGHLVGHAADFKGAALQPVAIDRQAVGQRADAAHFALEPSIGFAADHLLEVVEAALRATAKRRSSLDGRTTRHPGYAVIQRIRKRIEEGFGWGKEFGVLRRIRMRGRERVDMAFAFSATACNLIRLPKLLGKPAVA